MLVQLLDAPGFAVSEAGELTRSARWLLCASPGEENFAEAALAWAGKTGDPWRVPSADGRSYTASEVLVIASIKNEVIDSRSCEIHYQGKTALSGASGGKVDFERREDLTEYKIGKFTISGDAVEELVPQCGDLLDWAGEDYRCEKAEAKLMYGNVYQLTVTAVNTAVQPEGRITSEFNSQFEELKSGVWLVNEDAAADFLADNQVHLPALWAGENYYIHSVKSELADSARRLKITLHARYVDLQLIEVLRYDEVLSLGNADPEIQAVWKSRWRCQAADREFFGGLINSDASSWGGEGTVVTKVTPKRISDCEFEYELEARVPESVIPPYRHRYWRDRDLDTRTDYLVRMGEVRFSALQCGYSWNYRGNYVVSGNWMPTQQCPLDTNTPLDRRWINQPLKLMEVIEINYLRGKSSGNSSTIGSWFASGRVINTDLLNISGSWLKVDLKVEDITDSRDRQWTRISKVYRLAPAGFAWNSNYWV